MKYRILTVIIIIISIFSITASAANYEYTITPGSNFTSARYGEDLKELAGKMGVTTKELNTYFEKNSLIYVAISDDAKNQIKISVVDGALTDVEDISQLSDKALHKFAKTIDENYTDVVVNNDRKYVCAKNRYEDKGGKYTVTQYATIFDQKIISFIGYNDGENTSKEILSAFESFNIHETNNQSRPTKRKNVTFLTILIIMGIVLFTAIAIVMIHGIVRSIKNQNEI